MIVQYTGIRRINGPLIVLSGVENVAYDELVEIHLNDGTMRMGNVVDIEGSTAVVQVFEGTRGMSLGSSTISGIKCAGTVKISVTDVLQLICTKISINAGERKEMNVIRIFRSGHHRKIVRRTIICFISVTEIF